MSAHSFYSPSKGHMWGECFGAMAYPENQRGGGSSTYADDGTASHELAAWALDTGLDCAAFRDMVSPVIIVNGREYAVDDERCEYVQTYVDEIGRRSLGRRLFVEFRVDLSRYLGEGQGGTSDAVIVADNVLEVHDLKYGTGERVYASYGSPLDPSRRLPNHQLALYAAGVRDDVRMMGYEVDKVVLAIHQPRLNHFDEYEITSAELDAFVSKMTYAVEKNEQAMVHAVDSPEHQRLLFPSEKTCRWCRAKHRCPALAAFVASNVRADFETIEATPPQVPTGTVELGVAMQAVPLIEQWCKAVKGEVYKQVAAGANVLGPDGKPYKFVEGGDGKRQWADEKAAEAALLGVLPPEKAYKPREIITAPAAAKILDKKQTKAAWADVFVPLIKRAKGQPQLALGSDPRPPFTGTAGSDEFDEIQDITE